MLKLVRRAIELVVLFFAAYAFVSVPLGSRTGLEHVKTVFSTPEAKQAGDEIAEAGGQMLSELLGFKSPPYRGSAKLPKIPVPLPRTGEASEGTDSPGLSAPEGKPDPLAETVPRRVEAAASTPPLKRRRR